MNANASQTSSVRPKKSKLEKICELESSVKLLKEENRRLRKEMHVMKGVSPGAAESPRKAQEKSILNYKEVEVDKMKDALKALKSVTVNQERSLQSLRAKANQRRKELNDKDSVIRSLQKQVNSLMKAQQAIEEGNEGGDLRVKVAEAQRQCFEEETKNAKLTGKLEETELQVKQLLKQLKKGDKSSGSDLLAGTNGARPDLLKRDNSLRSMRSTDVSVSTTNVFDFTKMKKDLAKKSNTINSLEMELEMVKEELHELKKKGSSGGAFAEPFPDFKAFQDGDGGFGDFADDPFAFDDDGSFSDGDDDFW